MTHHRRRHDTLDLLMMYPCVVLEKNTWWHTNKQPVHEHNTMKLHNKRTDVTSAYEWIPIKLYINQLRRHFLSFLHSQTRHSPAASLKPEDVTVFVWNETKETESAPGLLLSHIHSAIKWTPTRHCRRTEGPHLYSAAATTSRLQFRCVCVCVFEEPFHPLMANYLLGTPRPGEEKENELKN